MTKPPRPGPGTVYLVGAGPGDPGLLTLRATECLGRADVVLYDYLANPAVLEHAGAAAELVPLGRVDSGRTYSPQEIVEMMVAEAQRGRTVVRLKGGDPSVFGRGADEIAPLREAGIPYEIVPGITSGLAAAAYCEIPVTHQDDASAIALIAGHERDDKEESNLDAAALAAFPGTLVFYMGVGRSKVWSRSLIEAGRSPDTPVFIVRACTRLDQETVRCTLGEVADVVARRQLKPPALFLVGEVAGRAPDTSWFTGRPLFGTRVLVTGSAATSARLRRLLTDLGANVTLSPAIRIDDPPDWAPVDDALDRIASFDWMVFVSPNGVDYLLRRLLSRGQDPRVLAGVRIAAIGSETAERLARYSLRADLVPDRFVAESLAEALLRAADSKRFLMVRASRGRDVLAQALSAAGTRVEQVVAYSSTDVADPDPTVAADLAAGRIDWVTITSGSTARSLARLYGSALDGVRFVSIGPIASDALRELGYEPAVEASPHSTAAMVEAIVKSESSGS